jgi:UDP-N-acetylglucosamine 2-epimerase (non-hydrolysing)
MNILIIFGTRPEAIKMAPVIYEFKKNNKFRTKVCISGQHRQMLQQVLDFFEIVPDYDLNLMTIDQSLNSLAGKLFLAIDEVLNKDNYDLIIVHGDTLTSSIAAWSAFHRGIKVAHVEAGLRTYNKFSPFPEELNRQITGRISDYHFAPTAWAKQNLISEGVLDKNIIISGNTVIDALLFGMNKINSGFENEDLVYVRSIINPKKKIVVVTGHRRENFGYGFENICLALKDLSLRDDIQIIYPVHLNPKVQEPVARILKDTDNINLIKPLDYPAFLFLISKAYVILTDSGGVQEEAPTLGKPVLVMRNNTERPEAVEVGTVKLVGTERDTIVSSTIELLNNDELYKKMSNANNPYGDGLAGKKIVNYFLQ